MLAEMREKMFSRMTCVFDKSKLFSYKTFLFVLRLISHFLYLSNLFVISRLYVI